MNLKAKKRPSILLTAFWGNDDASSSIRISPSRWGRIQQGEIYEVRAWSYYEGKRYSVRWSFRAKSFSIGAEDGAQWIEEYPVSELLIQTE